MKTEYSDSGVPRPLQMLLWYMKA